jgi:hypothetical protein
MKSIGSIVVVSLICLAACDKNPPETKPAETTNATATQATATAAQPTAAATAQVALADSDISTPADFEEIAEKSITPKTYKQELALLQAAIDKE